MSRKSISILTILLLSILLLNGCSSKEINPLEPQPVDTTPPASETTSDTPDVFTLYQTNYIPISEEQVKMDITQNDFGLFITLNNLGDISYQDLTPSVVFYNDSGEMVSYSQGYVSFLPQDSSTKAYIAYPTPYADQGGTYIPFSSYDITLKGIKAQNNIENKASEITVASNYDFDGNILSKLTNNSDKAITTAYTYIEYFVNGDCIGIESSQTNDIMPNSYTVLEYLGPTDTNYTPISYDNYKITVSFAY